MRGEQICGLILYFSFYSVFYAKFFLQKRRHVKTLQVIVGDKPRRTVIVELTLIVLLIANATIQFVSIVWAEKFPVLFTSDAVRNWTRWLGVFGAVKGIILLTVAMVTLRDSWKGGIDYRQKAKLVTTGIYRLSRNPGFLGFDLFFVGLFLQFPTLLTLIGGGLLIVLLHLQILEEEKYLAKSVGEVYWAYKKRTRRYF